MGKDTVGPPHIAQSFFEGQAMVLFQYTMLTSRRWQCQPSVMLNPWGDWLSDPQIFVMLLLMDEAARSLANPTPRLPACVRSPMGLMELRPLSVAWGAHEENMEGPYPFRQIIVQYRLGLSRKPTPALLMAASQADTPTRIRLGERWITDDSGRQKDRRPLEVLTPAELERWLRSRTYRILKGDRPRQDLLEQDNGAREASEYNPLDMAIAKHPWLGIPSPEALVEAKLDIMTLAAAAPPRERDILRLRLLDYTPEEIATSLGISRSSVYTYLSRLQERYDAL
jgi:hypothetical protein